MNQSTYIIHLVSVVVANPRLVLAGTALQTGLCLKRVSGGY